MYKSLKELAVITMGQSPKSSYYNTKGLGLPFIQGRTTFGRIYPMYDTWSSQWNKEALPNDILFTVRAPVGDVNISKDRIAIGRGIASIRAVNCNPIYLFYLLQANNNIFTFNSTGTIFESINKDTLENTLLNVHSNENQVHIVDTIGSIDNLIEKYNEILIKIDTLENNFYSFEILNIKKQKLQDFIKFEKGKKPTKITSFGEKYLTIDSLENSEITYTNCSKTLKCEVNDILMVMDGASSGKVYIGAKGAVGSTLALIHCQNINRYYLYIFLKNNYSSIKDRNTGSAIPHTNKEFVLNLNIPFNKISDKIYNQILEYKIAIKNNLSRLNDIKLLYLNKFFN